MHVMSKSAMARFTRYKFTDDFKFVLQKTTTITKTLPTKEDTKRTPVRDKIKICRKYNIDSSTVIIKAKFYCHIRNKFVAIFDKPVRGKYRKALRR